mgnify:CR=1 FL=1
MNKNPRAQRTLFFGRGASKKLIEDMEVTLASELADDTRLLKEEVGDTPTGELVIQNVYQ